MRNIYMTIIAIFTIFSLNAQTIEFSVIFKGLNSVTDNYQFALVATPSEVLNNTSLEDMGAGFYVPTGITIGNFELGTSGLPASEWSSQSLGSNGNGDAYFLSRIEAGGNSVSVSGTDPFELVLFDVIIDPNPTTGGMFFVENGDPVFDSLFVQNYININSGSGPFDAYSQNDPLANSISFSTLSNVTNYFSFNFKFYPNPTSRLLYIEGNTGDIRSIDIHSFSGQRLLRIINNFESIDLSSFDSGIYFVKVDAVNGSKTLKIIKE